MTEAEQELARAASGGDRDALEELSRRLYKPVCALAARLLPRPDQADDVAQETFARVSTHISQFDPSRPFSAWVFAIAANLCRDRCRRDKSIRFLESVDQQDVTIDAPPENNAIRRENRERVLRELESLPFDLKAIIALHFQQGLNAGEIAGSLGISVNAVRIRLFRALSSLRERVPIMKVWFGLLSVLAGLVSGWFACVWTRSWDAETQATGWPFTFAILKLEGDRWVDYIGQGWQVAANFLVGFSIGLVPFLAYILYQTIRRSHKGPTSS